VVFEGGLGFEIPFVGSGPVSVGVAGSAAYMIGSTSLNDKKSYPSSPAKGFDLLGGLRLTYASRLFFQASYLFQSYTTDFAAAGREPAATGSDRYQGPLLLLGYGG
jgi:hypothetical protein